jgi:hypothetical protein
LYSVVFSIKVPVAGLVAPHRGHRHQDHRIIYEKTCGL